MENTDPKLKISELLECDVFNDCKCDGKFYRAGKNNRYWAIGNEWNFKGEPYWALVCGDWATGEQYKDCSYDVSTAPIGLRRKAKSVDEEHKHKIAEEKNKKHKECALKWSGIYGDLGTVAFHEYLTRKKINTQYNLKIYGKELVIPVFNSRSEFAGVQRISSNGGKIFSSGIEINGSYYNFGDVKNARIVLLAEGFATASTIFKATGVPTMACFSAHNIPNTIRTIRKMNPTAPIIICADNDKIAEKQQYRTGSHYAEIAKKVDSNSTIVFPSDNPDDVCDFNDIGVDATKARLMRLIENPGDIVGESGFTTYGKNDRLIRDYDALWTYFNKKHPYFYIGDTRQLYVYNGTHFEIKTEPFFREFAQNHFLPVPRDSERTEFLKYVQANNLESIDIIQNNNPKLINFKNRVLNWETGETFDNSPKYRFTKVVPHDYNPKADCPTWDLLLGNLLNNKEHLCRQLEQFMGFALSGMDYSNIQKLMVFQGAGSNGKTTVLNIIKEVLGINNVSAVSMANANSSRFEMPQLEHSLLNIGEEEPKKAFQDGGLIKKLTGNSVMTMEHKGKPTYAFTNTSKIVLTYNELPTFKEFTNGMTRRFIIIPFNVNLDKRPDLKVADLYKKISAEFPGIINRFIQGIKVIMSEGKITNTIESDSMLEQIRVESDPVYDWFCQMVDVTNCGDDFVSTDNLFGNYMDFIGNNSKILKQTYSRRLASFLNYGSKTKRIGGVVFRGYYGVKLNL